MSGIIPPSIVTYDMPLDLGSSKYISVSFPFRVVVQQVWFTTDSNILNGTEGGYFDAERVVKLAAFKVKNTKTLASQLQDPTDGTNFFGTDTAKPYIMQPDESLKPTLWLGNPDSRPEGQVVQLVGFGGGFVFRSTSKTAPEINDPANVGWGNPDWSEEDFNQYSYKTELAVMNTDEVLVIFPYNSSGNWDNYTNGSALISINIAYTGAPFPAAQSAPTPLWTDWIND
jgi:hypothetical protein